jgi:NAD(P)-dependent dehydrogenase (short-subunit alcohol dehydrogenase family)
VERLKDRVALVTGGGSGLGAAICRVLAEEGAEVIVADIRGEAAERVAGDIRDMGHTARSLRLDVEDPVQVGELVGALCGDGGRLDVLANCAGVDRTEPFEAITVAGWDHVLGVNLRGPFLMSRVAFPVMRRQGGGHIVNIVSTAAKRAWANAAAYHASKWGLLGLSHALHVEGRPHQVKVTAVIAGGMRTPFLLDRFPELDPATLQEPRDVAQAVAFVLTQPPGTVVPEITVTPLQESSWP